MRPKKTGSWIPHLPFSVSNRFYFEKPAFLLQRHLDSNGFPASSSGIATVDTTIATSSCAFAAMPAKCYSEHPPAPSGSSTMSESGGFMKKMPSAQLLRQWQQAIGSHNPEPGATVES